MQTVDAKTDAGLHLGVGGRIFGELPRLLRVEIDVARSSQLHDEGGCFAQGEVTVGLIDFCCELVDLIDECLVFFARVDLRDFSLAVLLSKDESAESWVTNALESDDVESAAVNTTMDKRYGEKRASYDLNDPESSKNLMAQGYTIVHGRSLPASAWDSVRRSGAIQSSGAIAPTPKPYSDDPNAPPVKEVPEEKWNEGMNEIAIVAKELAKHLIGTQDLQVRYVLPKDRSWGACCDGYNLDFNVSKLGYKYFQDWHNYPQIVLNLLVHEFAHKKADDHLDETFHKECTRMAGEGMVLVMRQKIPYLTSLLHGYCDNLESDPDEWDERGGPGEHDLE